MRTEQRPRPSRGLEAHATPSPVRLSITSLAKGGEGVAHTEIDGARRTVLVAGTAPGDVVDAHVRRSGQALRGQIVSVVTASDQRTEPPCPHATRCGGCDLMHVTVDAQRLARTHIVREALGPLAASAAWGEHAAPVTAGYRTRVRLAAEVRRGRVVVGFRVARSHDIVQVDRCLVTVPALEPTRLQVAAWLEGSTGRGEVAISLGAAGRPSVSLSWDGELSASVFAWAERRVREGEWSGVQIALAGARKPAVIGDPRSMTTAIDGKPLLAPAGGFTQAFDGMNQRLAERVVRSAEPAGRKVLELFCGSGNLTVGLAASQGTVEAVEADTAAVECARENLACRGLQARIRCGDADATEIRDDVRVVVLNPPRGGAPGASPRIASSRARRVVMVSCDPATLARDLRRLTEAGAFAVSSVELFEMFPHTSHIETLVVLDRVKGR